MKAAMYTTEDRLRRILDIAAKAKVTDGNIRGDAGMKGGKECSKGAFINIGTENTDGPGQG